MKFFLILVALYSSYSYSAYYDVLPKGVRNFTYHYAQTSSITGGFSSSGNFKGYNINATINADSLMGLNSNVDNYLKLLSPAEYAAFSFGTFQGSAVSHLSVQAVGAGYGVSDKLTVYAVLPFYSGKVDLKVERTQKGRNSINGDVISLDQLPDVDARLLQSLFVNYFHYKPLGKWEAKDFGDAEVGVMYQTSKNEEGGALVTVGAIAPTGRKDDPDILQDVSFGDGKWDAFVEVGAGYNVNSAYQVEDWVRGTYQFQKNFKVRLPQSYTFPISQYSEIAPVKFGNKIQENFNNIYKFSDQWSMNLLYTFEYTEASLYKTSNMLANQILEDNTQKFSHSAKLGVNYSTVKLFTRKEFVMPLSMQISLQSIFAGKNVPRYELVEAEMRFYF